MAQGPKGPTPADRTLASAKASGYERDDGRKNERGSDQIGETGQEQGNRMAALTTTDGMGICYNPAGDQLNDKGFSTPLQGNADDPLAHQ